mgnify:CR=1 FL=1
MADIAKTTAHAQEGAPSLDNVKAPEAGVMERLRTGVAILQTLLMGAGGAALSSCTHTAELTTYRKDQNGRVTEVSETAGARMHYPGLAGLMGQTTFRFENMYVTQFKAHLIQQANRQGLDDCVNRFIARCPGLQGKGDELRLVNADATVESLFKFLVHEGVEMGKALALMHGLMNIPASQTNVNQTTNVRNSNKLTGGGSHTVCPPGSGTGGTLNPGVPGNGGNGITAPTGVAPTGVAPAGSVFSGGITPTSGY